MDYWAALSHLLKRIDAKEVRPVEKQGPSFCWRTWLCEGWRLVVFCDDAGGEFWDYLDRAVAPDGMTLIGPDFLEDYTPADPAWWGLKG